jgi:hypothetical protein
MLSATAIQSFSNLNVHGSGHFASNLTVASGTINGITLASLASTSYVASYVATNGGSGGSFDASSYATLAAVSALSNTYITPSVTTLSNLQSIGTSATTTLINGTLQACNLTVLGTTRIMNSLVTENSNLVIKNFGAAGPALDVYQTEIIANGIIAKFYNCNVSASSPALCIANPSNVGIGKSNPTVSLDVVGTINATNTYQINGTDVLSSSGATKVAGGSTNAVVYQSAANTTTFTAAGTAGQVFTANETGVPSWVNASTLSVGSATSATTATLATNASNLAGGATNTVPYQSANGATAFLTAGTSGQVFTAGAVGLPTWVNASTLTVGTATSATSATHASNLAGGATNTMPYQSANGATAFLTAGSSGQVFTAGAAGLPTWVNASTLTVGTATSATSATSATNLSGGAAGRLPYQSAAGTTLFTAAGTAGQVLTSQGTSAPTWTSLSKSIAVLSHNAVQAIPNATATHLTFNTFSTSNSSVSALSTMGLTQATYAGMGGNGFMNTSGANMVLTVNFAVYVAAVTAANIRQINLSVYNVDAQTQVKNSVYTSVNTSQYMFGSDTILLKPSYGFVLTMFQNSGSSINVFFGETNGTSITLMVN